MPLVIAALYKGLLFGINMPVIYYVLMTVSQKPSISQQVN